MSLQKFFEKFIADANMLVKIYDANMRKVIFRGRWMDIKTIDREYRGPRYQVLTIDPKFFGDYEELGLVINIDLKR